MEYFYTWKEMKLADEEGEKASSISVNPWSMPVTIKEISFHRSLNNRSIKLFSLLPSITPEAFYMQIAPSTLRDDFLQPFLK
jgi:hypothetical protein